MRCETDYSNSLVVRAAEGETVMTDKERLDWLEQMGYGLRSKYFGVRNLVVWGDQYGPGFDIRTCIDAAMKRHVLYIKRGEKPFYRIKGQPF